MVLRDSIFKIATGDSGLPKGHFLLFLHPGTPKTYLFSKQMHRTSTLQTRKLSEDSNQAPRALFTHCHKDGEVG